MALTLGSRLGTYEILGPVGAGGMGEVYRARDTRLGREIAIKVLPTEVASSPDRLARFEHEARTVARLNHPNIVVLHSIEEEDDVHFLTMELVEGKTLSHLVVPGGLPISRVLDLAIPLAEALVAAHKHGVVHRDLKPGNVMVTAEGRVKVLDFGLAKLLPAEVAADDTTLTAADATPLSEAGQVMGTAPYMAPEQIRGESVDARADLFATGIMLYELAAGRRPFLGETNAMVSASILRDMPEPLQSLRPDLPGELSWLVDRCLEKSPDARIQTALDVCNELRRLKQKLERESLPPAKPPTTRPDTASIAVLPFVNRSRDVEDEYFSEGLADELLHVLAKIRGLRVSARASSSYFKGKDVSLSEVGRALNVATVLDGSVRKAGNHVRISVQLVNVSDGCHLWSERYDRTLEDIFAVQDEIAQSVVKELRGTLLGGQAADSARQAKAEVAKATKGRSGNPEAHRLYLLARHIFGRVNPEGTAKGIDYLEQAVAMDPTFALAWAELSGAYGFQAGRGWAPMAEGYRKAREAVERSLALEPDLAEAHTTMMRIQMYHDWNWRAAEASNARALELAPGDPSVLNGAGVLARYRGRPEEAIEFHRRALEQDPLSLEAYGLLGSALETLRRFVEAEEAYRKMLELDPNRASIRRHLSLVLLGQGRGGEAVDEAMRDPDEPFRLYTLAIVHHVLGHGAKSDAALRELTGKHAEHMACQIAEVHGIRGEVDDAFEWLERAYAQRDPGLAGAKASPRLHSLRGDPRWALFLRKMGLED